MISGSMCLTDPADCVQVAPSWTPLAEPVNVSGGAGESRLAVPGVLGRDPQMIRMFDVIYSIADTQTTVLILGESGTGKTLAARAVHELSSRRQQPFLEVSCGALPETRLESELFGHVAGGFAGAIHDRAGKLLTANGGTVFLDEAGGLSPSLQVRLLRVLENREFEPLGTSIPVSVDVRLILATSQNIESLVAQGKFRQDLYYRVSVITLHTPALRERAGDIPLLLDHYLREFSIRLGRSTVGFTDNAVALLQRYPWPGNVRELVHVVERMVLLSKNRVIDVDDLPDAIRGEPGEVVSGARGLNSLGLKSALARPERQIILEALDSNGWNRQHTAQMLGINRATLYKKMKKYAIQPS
jgi:DNA-binding NtrC family response regulator